MKKPVHNHIDILFPLPRCSITLHLNTVGHPFPDIDQRLLGDCMPQYKHLRLLILHKLRCYLPETANPDLHMTVMMYNEYLNWLLRWL